MGVHSSMSFTVISAPASDVRQSIGSRSHKLTQQDACALYVSARNVKSPGQAPAASSPLVGCIVEGSPSVPCHL
eukprot:340120-Hanusia_phi.AAC.2